MTDRVLTPVQSNELDGHRNKMRKNVILRSDEQPATGFNLDISFAALTINKNQVPSHYHILYSENPIP